MTNLIKSNFKIFFKSVYLCIAFLLFFIILNGYLLLGIHNLTIHKDAFFYLQYTQRISMIYLVFFTFISYEYLVKSKNNNLLEGISPLHKGILKLYFSKIIVLIIIALIMTLNIFLYNLGVYIVMKVNSTSFLLHIVLNNLLNMFLISIFAIFLGSTISLYFKRFAAYSTMILSILLISPISESIPFILFMGYGINIYFLREPFDILPPNLDWESEYLYGLSIEAYRWNILAFWIGLFSFFLILKLSKRKYKSLNIIATILLIFSVFNFYGFTRQASIVKKDHNPKNFVAFDELYYSNDVQKEEKASFKIAEYNMKLNINRQLQNDATIYLDEKEPLKSYKFTLYRNYKIEKVFGKNNETLEYKRDGDYLEIINPTNKKLGQIRILYNGASPVFYSNYQGVLLPGFFPYYPMEGYKRIYLKEQGIFIPTIRDYSVKFNVAIKSNLDIFSNLNKNGEEFSGKAQELTLMGGMLEEKSIKDNIFYGLTLNRMDTNIFSEIDTTLNSYKKVLLAEDNFTIKDKKIFQSPATLSCKVIGNGTIAFKDHIFVFQSNKEDLSIGLIQSSLGQDTKKRKINDILFTYLSSKSLIINTPKELLEEDPYYKADKFFLEKLKTLGEDYVIKNTYKFLKDKNDKRDSLTFIKELK